MAEWLHEAGIGEARAALVKHGEIIEAAIECDDGKPRAGTIAEGRLVEIITPRLQGRVTLSNGCDVLLEGIPPGLSEGRTLLVRIVREANPEPGRNKLPKCIPAPDETLPRPGPDLLARITASGHPVRLCKSHEPDSLDAALLVTLEPGAYTAVVTGVGGATGLALVEVYDVN